MTGPILEIENLTGGYGAAEILHGVSFSIEDGSITALLGSNGAGKTTLMRSLAGLVTPRGGRIRFAGSPLETLPNFMITPASIVSIGAVPSAPWTSRRLNCPSPPTT